MCEKCEELRRAFLDADGICPKQTAWNAWDKQRTKCAKGKAAPEPEPAKEPEKKPKEKKVEVIEPEPKPAKAKKPTKAKPVKQKPAKQKWEPIPVNPAAPVKKPSKCKYHYCGGLCANSNMDKPFCYHEKDPSQCPALKPDSE